MKSGIRSVLGSLTLAALVSIQALGDGGPGSHPGLRSVLDCDTIGRVEVRDGRSKVSIESKAIIRELVRHQVLGRGYAWNARFLTGNLDLGFSHGNRVTSENPIPGSGNEFKVSNNGDYRVQNTSLLPELQDSEGRAIDFEFEAEYNTNALLVTVSRVHSAKVECLKTTFVPSVGVDICAKSRIVTPSEKEAVLEFASSCKIVQLAKQN